MVPMAGKLRSALPAAITALFLLATSCGTGSAPIAATSPPSIAITVDGERRDVPPGTTFGQVVASLGLSAKDGRLLSVAGDVLKRHADPGQILLDGTSAKRTTIVEQGDQITVQNGRDRIEPSTLNTTTFSGKRVADPQFSLATYALKRTQQIGKISGEIGRISFRTSGPAHAPRSVALCFDDGPWPVQTVKVLKILHHFHVKATFFMIGEQVARWPGIAQRVKAAGMTIGDHSWDHPNNIAFASLTPHRIEEEIAKAKDALQNIGVDPYLFRPPGGSFDPYIVSAAAHMGMRVVIWNVDSRDWVPGSTKKEIEKRVLSAVRPGSIVLMHDGGGDRSATIAALPDIIKTIRKRGLKLVTLGKL
jgi:peptidoglycan/xylan/chitin deacetylase (PgdA/CDA1 family)